MTNNGEDRSLLNRLWVIMGTRGLKPRQQIAIVALVLGLVELVVVVYGDVRIGLGTPTVFAILFGAWIVGAVLIILAMLVNYYSRFLAIVDLVFFSLVLIKVTESGMTGDEQLTLLWIFAWVLVVVLEALDLLRE